MHFSARVYESHDAMKGLAVRALGKRAVKGADPKAALLPVAEG